MELQLDELVATVAEGKAPAAIEAVSSVDDKPAQKPAPRALPAHLPRERVVHQAPCACAHCGSDRLRKLGEVTTETLELIPISWKVISHVREKFSCRACEKITETPAPSHLVARGRAGPQLLAHILFSKYGVHLPLNRQSDIYEAEGVHLDVSTLADWVGACAATLAPPVEEIEKHVLAAERIHADDTTVPVLSKNKCVIGRLWTYVRDDAPFGGSSAPAAVYSYSPTRGGEHPEQHLANYSGLMQADAHSGYNGLYAWPRRHASGAPAASAGRIIEAACWAHGRRKFFELSDLQKAPVAIEAVRRIDELFSIERDINGRPPTNGWRFGANGRSHSPATSNAGCARNDASSRRKAPVAKAIDYSLKRWPAFTRFLDDGRVCMSNNAAERPVRGIAVGRKNWTFCGSDSGGRRAAAIYTLIETCKLNDVDTHAWLAVVLARIADHPAKQIADLLPWNWKPTDAAAMELRAVRS